MNHALRRISLVVLAMFLLLLLSVNYVQAFEPSSLAVQRGNARVAEAAPLPDPAGFSTSRGAIHASENGVPCALGRAFPVRILLRVRVPNVCCPSLFALGSLCWSDRQRNRAGHGGCRFDRVRRLDVARLARTCFLAKPILAGLGKQNG